MMDQVALVPGFAPRDCVGSVPRAVWNHLLWRRGAFCGRAADERTTFPHRRTLRSLGWPWLKPKRLHGMNSATTLMRVMKSTFCDLNPRALLWLPFVDLALLARGFISVGIRCFAQRHHRSAYLISVPPARDPRWGRGRLGPVSVECESRFGVKD